MAPVAESYATRAVDAYDILVELAHLDNDARLVPLGGMRSHQVLKADAVTGSERRQYLGVLGEAFVCAHVPVPESLLAVGQRFPPCAMRSIPPWMYRYEVAYRTSEEHLCWREAGVAIRGVAILQHGALEEVSVQSASGERVVAEKALHGFDRNLGPTVPMRMCDGGEAVSNAPVAEECLSRCGGELWSTVGGEFLADPVRDESSAQSGDEAIRSI